MTIMSRLRSILDRVQECAAEVGRPPEEISVIAVSKRQPLERVLEAYELGVRDFGENTAQGLKERVAAFEERGLTEARWHFIGHLQSNKAKMVVPVAHRIHSVDRWSLVEAITKRLPEEGADILVQVNLGDESQKSGVLEGEALEFANKVAAEPGLRFRGFMAIPPVGDDATAHFERLRVLSEDAVAWVPAGEAVEISMGMSGDFEQAIRCGATHIRVGTAIFGPRL